MKRPKLKRLLQRFSSSNKNMYDLISANKRRSVFLLLGFVMLVIAAGVAAGQVLGNPVVGTSIALIFSALMAGTSYWK